MRPQKPPEETVDAAYPMYLTTGRIIEHWHTGTMTRSCKELRHANAEALLEIHPQDAARLGIASGDQVKVVSRRGSDTFRAKVTDATRQGLVFLQMHDDRRMCNRVTIDAVDPISRQPEYKICAVRVEKA
jgi:nitrate reductase NapA